MADSHQPTRINLSMSLRLDEREIKREVHESVDNAKGKPAEGMKLGVVVDT